MAHQLLKMHIPLLSPKYRYDKSDVTCWNTISCVDQSTAQNSKYTAVSPTNGSECSPPNSKLGECRHPSSVVNKTSCPLKEQEWVKYGLCIYDVMGDSTCDGFEIVLLPSSQIPCPIPISGRLSTTVLPPCTSNGPGGRSLARMRRLRRVSHAGPYWGGSLTISSGTRWELPMYSILPWDMALPEWLVIVMQSLYSLPEWRVGARINDI